MRLFTLLLALSLAACAGSRPKTQDIRYYTLEYDPPAISAATSSSAIVSIARFGVAPDINTPRMIYRDLSFGRQEYAYHQWRVTPQTLVMDFLRRDFRDSGLFAAVTAPGSTVAPTHQLEGILEQWMEVDGPDSWTATAEVTVTLLNARAKSAPDQVLFQRAYKASAPCAKKNPAAVAEAMSRAMRDLSGRIIADVAQAVRQ